MTKEHKIMSIIELLMGMQPLAYNEFKEQIKNYADVDKDVLEVVNKLAETHGEKTLPRKEWENLVKEQIFKIEKSVEHHVKILEEQLAEDDEHKDHNPEECKVAKHYEQNATATKKVINELMEHQDLKYTHEEVTQMLINYGHERGHLWQKKN